MNYTISDLGRNYYEVPVSEEIRTIVNKIKQNKAQ